MKRWMTATFTLIGLAFTTSAFAAPEAEVDRSEADHGDVGPGADDICWGHFENIYCEDGNGGWYVCGRQCVIEQVRDPAQTHGERDVDPVRGDAGHTPSVEAEDWRCPFGYYPVCTDDTCDDWWCKPVLSEEIVPQGDQADGPRTESIIRASCSEKGWEEVCTESGVCWCQQVEQL
jgi:hypothetical protein